MFTVYVLQSSSYSRYYTGYSADVEKRLEEHNSGSVFSTKPYLPYKIVYTEVFETRGEAMSREKQIKRMKGGIGFKNLVQAQ